MNQLKKHFKSKRHFIHFLFATLSIVLLSCMNSDLHPDATKSRTKKNSITIVNDSLNTNQIHIENPIVVENLGLFIITGEERIQGKHYKTLSEAMKTNQVSVKETGTVNEIAIDNNSDDTIFIHSGDIVKGGKQDRTISYDVIIPPRTKNIALQSFCVEQGRWEKRAGETVSSFGTNSKMLSSRDLKLAAKHEKNQSKVWSKVAEQKNALSDKLTQKNGYSVNVADNESNTSLQLALESRELDTVKKAFYSKLKNAINTPNAIGYAYAINGEIYGVEIYNNHQLFNDLWEKILESIIVEAVSKQEDKKDFSTTKEQVATYLKSVKKSDKNTRKKINKMTNFNTLENKSGHVLFTTEDINQKKWIHKSYMKSDTTSVRKDSNIQIERRYRNN